MIVSIRFHFTQLTRAHLLLILLLAPWVYHVADAQSPIQPAPSFVSYHRWDPSIAVMVGAIFCAFLFMGVFSIYLRHCAESYFTAQNPIGFAADWPCSCSEGISKEVLDTFPILVYSAIKGLKIGKGALECAICLSEFKDCDTLRLLPKCSHVFHPDCIDAWLASHVTCPVCRAKLNSDCGQLAITVPAQLPANELSEENPESGEIEQQEVVPNLNEDQSNSNSQALDVLNVDGAAGKQNCSGKTRIVGKLPRSNSTGHSVVEPGKDLERYTLRLPDDVRKYILLNHGTIQRSASYNVVMPTVGSSKKGLCWSDSEGSSRGKRDSIERQERWVFSRTPPFVSRV